jgi:hypothetical protein
VLVEINKATGYRKSARAVNRLLPCSRSLLICAIVPANYLPQTISLKPGSASMTRPLLDAPAHIIASNDAAEKSNTNSDTRSVRFMWAFACCVVSCGFAKYHSNHRTHIGDHPLCIGEGADVRADDSGGCSAKGVGV